MYQKECGTSSAAGIGKGFGIFSLLIAVATVAAFF